MLKKGDVISYGTTGVCKVEGECEQTVKGQKKRYIVLKPVHQINSTLYVPVDNDELKTKFKPLLTGDEIEEIIKEMPEESSLWKESSSERPIRDTSLEKTNKKFADLAGVKRIRIHDFRHSHASLLANEGINIQEIARRLGHSNISMTWNTYSHLYPREEERAVKILNTIV